MQKTKNKKRTKKNKNQKKNTKKPKTKQKTEQKTACWGTFQPQWSQWEDMTAVVFGHNPHWTNTGRKRQ